MKDHYRLDTNSGILRQAIVDSAFGYAQTITDIVNWQLYNGHSVERLVDFAHRRLHVEKEVALISILIITDRLN